MFCIHCGASNPRQSKFCNACGRALLVPSDSAHAPASRWIWLLSMLVLAGVLSLLYSTRPRSSTDNPPVPSSESSNSLAPPSVSEPSDKNLSGVHRQIPNQQIPEAQTDPQLVNLVLHPYDLVQNPFLYKHKLIGLDVSSLPILLNGAVFEYRPTNERYARLGYAALLFQKMLSEDQASYEVRGLDADASDNSSMLGQLIVILPTGLSHPPALDNEWLVEPLGAAQGTNALGGSVSAPIVRFVRYWTVREAGSPQTTGEPDQVTGRTTPRDNGADPPRAGEKGYGTPVCVYCPQPGYSDDAIKAKHFEGVVVLEASVTPEGRATNVHVIKAIGLGLDIKALEIIPTWRFKPALGPDGRPASVVTRIECKFHLDSSANGVPK